MEPRLVHLQTQKLILSPQIRQYLRLLPLPLLQLRAAIEQEMTENPVLEEVSKETREEGPVSAEENHPPEERGTDELRFDETVQTLDKLDENLRESLYSEQDLSIREPKSLAEQRDYQESLLTRKESLFEYLQWQVGFLELKEREQKIAEEIIGNLTEEGYLALPLEELAQTCGVSGPEAEAVLQKIQSLDPPGIAARDLQETLLLQLDRKGPEAALALRIVQDYFTLLEKKHWEPIARLTQATPEDIRKAAGLIARLDPKPGRTFYSEEPLAITPDASVAFDDEDGRLRVEIYDDDLPELRISPYYRRLLKSGKLDPQSQKFLREKIQSAMDFMKALAQRRSTVRGITEEIVKAQESFFEKGFSELRPLRLKDIAASLNIHESTVSRAIQEKYLSTPQGTLPYKSFFSSKMERTEGGVESQKSIQEKVRELIRAEDPAQPLSDQRIAEILQKEGIKIARRTVAKYREMLKILPSHLRSRQ